MTRPSELREAEDICKYDDGIRCSGTNTCREIKENCKYLREIKWFEKFMNGIEPIYRLVNLR